MASANYSETVSETLTQIFDATADGGNCSKFIVGCNPDSDYPILINIPNLHQEDQFIPVAIGGVQEFQCNIYPRSRGGISEVWVKGNGGDALIDYGVTGKHQ